MTINMMGFFCMMPMLMAGAVSRDWLVATGAAEVGRQRHYDR
jgi:hypothetical protein